MSTLAQAEAWVRERRPEPAFELATRLLARDPHDARALAVLANAANALGRIDPLIDALQRLHALRPGQASIARNLATALNNRAAAARRRQDAAHAVVDLHAALALDPAQPQAGYNLALALLDLGRSAEAVDALTRHLAVAAGDGDAALLLASLQPPRQAAEFLAARDAAALARLDAGLVARIAVRADALELVADTLRRVRANDDLRAATDAMLSLAQAGEAEATSAAAAAIGAACAARGLPSLRSELAGALALPAIHPDTGSIARWRQRYLQGLDTLEARWSVAHLSQPRARLRDIAHGNFLLAYQGHDDRAPQQRFGALLARACTQIAPQWLDPAAGPRRGRIGLLSSSWRDCTVGHYFGGWIAWLHAAGHPVHLYQLGPQQDPMTQALGAQASVFRLLLGSLEDAATAVREDELDLLIYPELGMDARLLPLASLRLARRQAVAWGHPVTSGLPSIDDFLSCAAMEPHDAPQHYSERLHLLPGLGVDYRRPPLPEPLEPEALGLPPRPRVLVPQSLFKLHPDGDRVLAMIAARRPDVAFVMFEAEQPRWQAALHGRLERAFAAVDRRLDRHLVTLALGTRERYLQVNQACDVMLDSLHWSGGNTAIDALLCGLPLVACPGTSMRSRQSHAMLEALGLDTELSCPGPAPQALRVLELLDDAGRRHAVSLRITEGLDALFDATDARRGLLAYVEGALAAPGG